MPAIRVSKETHKALFAASQATGKSMGDLITDLVSDMVPAPVSKMPGENWRPVPRYPDYEVSDLGRVRHGGRMLKAVHTSKGRYASVGLYRNGKPKKKTVHSLVMEAFVGPRPPGMHICHGNGNALDNRLSNLRYGTPQENVDDSFKSRCHIVRPNGERY